MTLPFFCFHGLANPLSDEPIDLSPPSDHFAEFLIDNEARLLSGEGPFEISGDPSSFAVAWVDDDKSEKNVLSIALFEGNRISLIHIHMLYSSHQHIFFLLIDPNDHIHVWSYCPLHQSAQKEY